jgi:hypothetical protein
MSALFDARQRDARDATDLARANEREVDGDRIDELEKANLALLDEVAGLIGDIERVSKERDEWRERYAELVEVTATRTDQAALARS